LLATCAALLGAKLPTNAGEDSCNILPALLGKKLRHPIREATVLHGYKGSFAIRQGEWVLIDAPSGDGIGGKNRPGELYNLREDLAQRHNLYGDKPEVVRRLKALLEKYKAQGRSTPGPPLKNTPASE
jgi:arylsulfatase A